MNDSPYDSPYDSPRPGGFVNPNYNQRKNDIGLAKAWFRSHKDEIMIAGLLVLGYKHRKLRKGFKKMLDIDIAHAKVTRDLANTGVDFARRLEELETTTALISKAVLK